MDSEPMAVEAWLYVIPYDHTLEGHIHNEQESMVVFQNSWISLQRPNQFQLYHPEHQEMISSLGSHILPVMAYQVTIDAPPFHASLYQTINSLKGVLSPLLLKSPEW